ncbi:hypothetical protein D3C87_1162720 [compost metagenome]
MIYFVGSVLVLIITLVIAPFYLFPEKMEAYGGYLTGLAAIGAALKFVFPYLLILFYRNRYSNELLWNNFLEVSSPGTAGRVLETEWIAGLINYFRRGEDLFHKGNPWYDKLPYLADDIYLKFGGKRLIGKAESKLFEEIKNLLFECAGIVAMNSTPNSPFTDEEKYKVLHNKFRQIVAKSDEMNSLIIDVPVPVKRIIEGDDFFKSLI